MFPLKDTIRSRAFPVANATLIVINLLVFFYQLTLGPRVDAFIMQWGLTPVRFFWGLQHNPVDAFLPILTSMFLHGGWFHVLGNMWFLFIFGDNVEDRMGHFGYLLFYLLCGVGAAVAQTLAATGSSVPMVGASGAIAGVLGAYFLLYPQSRILTLIPIFIFIQIIEIPAWVFLPYWFIMQFIQGALSPPSTGGVAWWAHIGGFLVGMIAVWIFRKPERRPPAYDYFR